MVLKATGLLDCSPLGYAAGDTNLYRFVGNNPTNMVDPSGLEAEPLTREFDVDSDQAFRIMLGRILGYWPSPTDMQVGSVGCVGLCQLIMGTEFTNPLKGDVELYSFSHFPSAQDIQQIKKASGCKCNDESEARVFMVQFHGYHEGRDRYIVPARIELGSGNVAYGVHPNSVNWAGHGIKSSKSSTNFDYLTYTEFASNPESNFWLHMNHGRSSPGAQVKTTNFSGVKFQYEKSFEEYVVGVKCGARSGWYERQEHPLSGRPSTWVYTVPPPIKR